MNDIWEKEELMVKWKMEKVRKLQDLNKEQLETVLTAKEKQEEVIFMKERNLQ